jgi:hypothetical protein
MSRRILSLVTVFAVAAGLTVTATGCSDNKSASDKPSIKGGGGGDPQAPGPVQRGGAGQGFKGND